MKPFDLEGVKRGEPIITRGGQHVKFIAHVPEAQEGSQVLVLDGSTVRHHFSNGRYNNISTHISDLFMAPKKRTVWVNLYPGSLALWYESEDAANENASDDRIGNRAHPIEIEE